MTAGADVVDRFLARAGLERTDDLRAVVAALRAVPYGRPEPRTEEGLVAQWRGTCSTKHALLARSLAQLRPGSDPRLVHRVYRLTREEADARYGAAVAARVPAEGLVDVHTYVVATLEGRDVRLDVTFPGPAWDGVHDMPIAAAKGEDVPGGVDPVATKAALVRKHCDPTIREPFIATLGP